MSQHSTIQSALKEFNISSFREGQEEIINDVMEGKDVLGILPTGSGKSLCYQLPAKVFPGSTIVVSPLISLMLDQVKQLKANHFKDVVALTSFMERSERLQVYKSLQSYKLIYVSPEILQNQELLNYLAQIEISLFVIDEAHCISQWGHEFRPDYLKLNETIKLLNNPPILALSATVTEHVQTDIIDSLKRPQMALHIYPIDRKNIAFNVCKVQDNVEKIELITTILEQKQVPTIIYFSSRIATEEIAGILSHHLSSLRIAFYHGDMDQYDRVIIQQQFMHDQLDVICCTSAFGMGINKPNIGLIIHYHLPSQIESFIQEVGRAGRSGDESVSVLLYSDNDVYIPRNMIKNELPTEEMVNNAFKILYNLNKAEARIPTNTNEIETVFGFTESQWRFFKAQLEKNFIIKNDVIIYDQLLWDEIKQHIIKTIEKRYKLKQLKLTEMIAWINETECLRKHLYKSFQLSYSNPTFQCCSNCGFSFENWEVHHKVNKGLPTLTWEHKLKKIFLIEEKNETK